MLWGDLYTKATRPGPAPWDTQLKATLKAGTGEIQAGGAFCAHQVCPSLAPNMPLSSPKQKKEPVTQTGKAGKLAENPSTAETRMKLQSGAPVHPSPAQRTWDRRKWGKLYPRSPGRLERPPLLEAVETTLRCFSINKPTHVHYLPSTGASNSTENMRENY